MSLSLQPFALVFSSEQACYSEDLGELYDALPPTVKALVEGFDPSSSSPEALRSLLEDLDLEDEDQEAVDDAVESLTPHYGCCCAADSWQLEEEAFNSVLEELPDTLWAVAHSGGDSCEDLASPFTVSEVYDRARGDRGWDEISLVWDGSSLTASFTSWGYGSDELVVRPLTPEQKQRAEEWESRDYYNSDRDFATRTLQTPQELFEFALQADDILVENNYPVSADFHDLVEAAKEVWSGFDAVAQEILLGLIAEWDSDLTSLFETARSLAAPAPAC